MAKPIRRKEQQKRKNVNDTVLPLGKVNLQIIGVGILVIVAGYLCMLEGSVEGFLPLVVSPILLILGYCVVVPVGIMYHHHPKAPETPEQSVAANG